HVWGVTPERVVEETDTILLLWYLELAGRPLENEWKLVAPYLTHKVLEHVYPFLNAIHIFTLARAGKTDEARHAVFELDRFANSIGDAQSLSWHVSFVRSHAGSVWTSPPWAGAGTISVFPRLRLYSRLLRVTGRDALSFWDQSLRRFTLPAAAMNSEEYSRNPIC